MDNQLWDMTQKLHTIIVLNLHKVINNSYYHIIHHSTRIMHRVGHVLLLNQHTIDSTHYRHHNTPRSIVQHITQ